MCELSLRRLSLRRFAGLGWISGLAHGFGLCLDGSLGGLGALCRCGWALARLLHRLESLCGFALLGELLCGFAELRQRLCRGCVAEAFLVARRALDGLACLGDCLVDRLLLLRGLVQCLLVLFRRWRRLLAGLFGARQLFTDLRFLLGGLRHLFGGGLQHVFGQLLERCLHRRVLCEFLFQSFECCGRVLLGGRQQVREVFGFLEGVVESLLDAEVLLHFAQGLARLFGEGFSLLDAFESVGELVERLGQFALFVGRRFQGLRLLLRLLCGGGLLEALLHLC